MNLIASTPVRTALVVALVVAGMSPRTRAQHAADNVVVSAEDAFGLTIGPQTVGLYDPTQIRGFSPQLAGNVRIDGLYFDQQAPPSNRILEDSTIRVGISAQGYAFPAPTGIVEYELRHVNDMSGLTAVIYSGPFQTRGFDLDAQVPVDSIDLRLPVGVSYRTHYVTPSYATPGVTSTVVTYGAAPQWKPNDRITVRAFVDWQRTTDAKTMPVIYAGSDSVPPRIEPRYFGQHWTNGESIAENYGATVDMELSRHWSVTGGVFRSANNALKSYADLFLGSQPVGVADHQLIGYPDQRAASTSGEARLTGVFPEGSRQHTVVLSLRGRSVDALYGGADIVDFGSSVVGEAIPLSRPDFSYGPLTRDKDNLSSVGLAYRVHWNDRGDLSIGLQRNQYSKTVTAPDKESDRQVKRPWLPYGTVAAKLANNITFYAGYTQGFEDSGVAPSDAANRGAILPASRTWQYDAGFRYSATSTLNIITGVFALHKPYFYLNSDNIYEVVGQQERRGIELSIAGEVFKNLNVVAGSVWMPPKVVNTNFPASGNLAVAQFDRLTQVAVDYRLPQWSALSLDLSWWSYGRRVADLDNSVKLGGDFTLDFGARYRFAIGRAQATLRILFQNATNQFAWNITDDAGFTPSPPRNFQAYVTVDL